MRVSLKWLRDYVDISLPTEEVARRLTSSVMEVGGIEHVGGQWQNIVVGEVVALAPHPNADRLRLVSIDLGGEQITVVSGAPNLEVGAKVPFARVGARLIDGKSGQPFQLEAAVIRGVRSEGMACSQKELGISDSHQVIMILPPEAPVGTPLAQLLGDTILDLEVPPNRPDCLSLIGVAREVAALTQQTLRLPSADYRESGPATDQLVSVEVAAPELCPRYCAALITGIIVAPSPRWLEERLIACGMRPINNIVDVTNYVLLEYGQPLHAFDFDRIRGRSIIVRRARDGEIMTTLDGVERNLGSDVLVIADAQGAMALAGVMGGADSEMTAQTTSVLLESANFDRVSIRGTSAKLRLRSESSLRFEKGLSPELPLPALRRAAQLVTELAGGEAAAGIVDVYPGKEAREPILLSAAHVRRLLGMELEIERLEEVLTSLGFDCRAADTPSELWCTAPYWRGDINLVADLVEEIARIIGYDSIPTTMPSGALPQRELDTGLALGEKVRDILVGCGLQEVITYSLTSLEMLSRVIAPSGHPGPAALRVANPMTAEQEYLRTTLRPGLLATLSFNQRHELGGIGLFEIGKIYLPRGKELPEEREMLAAVLCGPRLEAFWLGEAQLWDLFDVKGMVETLLSRLGVEGSFEAKEEANLHPGRAAEVVVGGTRVGVVGELHPKVAGAFDVSGAVYLIEIDLAELLPLSLKPRRYQALPRYPGTVRDIALVVDSGLAAQSLRRLIESFPLVAQVTLFDVYTGRQVAPGKKSLAYRIVYQSPTRTLTDEEVDESQRQILERLHRELGAALRT